MNKFWNWVRDEDGRTLYLNGTIAEESWFEDEITPAAFKAELMAGEQVGAPSPYQQDQQQAIHRRRAKQHELAQPPEVSQPGPVETAQLLRNSLRVAHGRRGGLRLQAGSLPQVLEMGLQLPPDLPDGPVPLHDKLGDGRVVGDNALFLRLGFLGLGRLAAPLFIFPVRENSLAQKGRSGGDRTGY